MTEMVSGELHLYPAAVRVSFGRAITPALLTRMCNGPLQLRTKPATEPGSAKSSGATCGPAAPDGSFSAIPSATFLPASRLRTASVTSAPVDASARAVSTPMPELAPVTTARFPCKSTLATISAAVVVGP
jgi:hypothetical protein